MKEKNKIFTGIIYRCETPYGIYYGKTTKTREERKNEHNSAARKNPRTRFHKVLATGCWASFQVVEEELGLDELAAREDFYISKAKKEEEEGGPACLNTSEDSNGNPQLRPVYIYEEETGEIFEAFNMTHAVQVLKRESGLSYFHVQRYAQKYKNTGRKIFKGFEIYTTRPRKRKKGGAEKCGTR